MLKTENVEMLLNMENANGEKTMKKHLWIAISLCWLTLVSTSSSASVFNFTYTGVFTVQDSSGNLLNNVDASTNTWSGYRTDIAGTFSFDDLTGTGVLTVDPFDFFQGGPVQFTSGLAQTTGTSNLMIGNFIFDWNGNTGVNMDLVWDISGLVDALNLGMTPGDIISGNQVFIGGNPFAIGSALPASNSVTVGSSSFPIGPAPMATTAFDLTGGTLPLITDSTGIGGSPMSTGPYITSSMSLDIGNANSMELVSITPSAVPVPAAVWLFGSGLLAILGTAGHRSHSFS